MNAKFLERIVLYRERRGLEVAEVLLSQKIEYQFAIIGKREAAKIFLSDMASVKSTQEALLVEARAARAYWKEFHLSLKEKAPWHGRIAHHNDAINKLLDIGYHYLAQKIAGICEEIALPTELGIFHKAQSAKARPLVYDFMEIMRPVMVDDMLLKMIHKKKIVIENIDDKIIKSFLYRIKKKGKTLCFHKKLGYCIELDYWVRLVLLDFMAAVNTSAIYKPLFPSTRHESRCKKKKPPLGEAVI